MLPRLILLKGAGDLATGVAHRLWYAGFDIVMLELPEPLVVRRTVSFASAIYEEGVEVEGVMAKRCLSSEEAEAFLQEKIVPVIIDPEGGSIEYFKPQIVVDAIMAKGNRLTDTGDAELVIGLGPGFTAGRDVHVVIETKRGHDLGRVIYSGRAAEDTAEPGKIEGYGRERLLRSPCEGKFQALRHIGDLVKAGDIVARVDDIDLKAGLDGLLRGLLHSGLNVKAGMKVGDIDPRGSEVDYYSISDKARAIGGGVLEAILHFYNR